MKITNRLLGTVALAFTVYLGACAATRQIATTLEPAIDNGCDFVAVKSGERVAGVVCTGLVNTLVRVIESLPVKASNTGNPAPCKLARVTQSGRVVGFVCEAYAAPFSSAVDPDAGK